MQYYLSSGLQFQQKPMKSIPPHTLEPIRQEPSLQRANRHFRIKSCSKERLLQAVQQVFTLKSKRKSLPSDSRPASPTLKNTPKQLRKESSNQSIQQRHLKQPVQPYEGVRTEENINDSKRYLASLSGNTVPLDSRFLSKINKAETRGLTISKERLQQIKKISCGDLPNKKQSLKQKDKEKLFKGIYRCRVSQFVFEQSKRRVVKIKDQEQSQQQFWKAVNESMILPQGEEEPSIDLRNLIVNMVTE